MRLSLQMAGGDTLIIFATEAYTDLRDAVCRAGGFDVGHTETTRFPDGERYMRLVSPVDGRDAVLVGGTLSESDTLEMFDLACGLSGYGARRLTLVVPYFGYSTMDRAVKYGEVVTAKNRARLLSSIPAAAFGNRVFMVDLHTEGLPQYFEGGIRPVHIYASPLVINAARELGGENFVLACTDAGRAKWVESLANDLGVTASFVFKRRLDGERTEVTAVSAQVEDQHVVIYDDMIRTGSSLLRAAEAYKAAGASTISAVATHGIFPEGALARLAASDDLDRIIVTDSVPHTRELAAAYPDLLEVRSIADLLVNALRQHP